MIRIGIDANGGDLGVQATVPGPIHNRLLVIHWAIISVYLPAHC